MKKLLVYGLMSIVFPVLAHTGCVRSSDGEATLQAVSTISNGAYEITGRTTMGTEDRNQCGIQYTGSERVGNPPMLIAGIDSRNFGTMSDGTPTGICGQIVEVNINGTVMDFVIVDRIFQNTSSNQLDVAKEVYYSGPLHNKNLSTDQVRLTGKIQTGLTCDSWVMQSKYQNSFCHTADTAQTTQDGFMGSSVGGYSCEDQQKWGKCGQTWMSPVCDYVCNSGAQTSSASSAGNGSSSAAATISVKNVWQGGYCADIIVSNTGSAPINSWTLDLNKNGAGISQTWNLQVIDNGQSVTVKPNNAWNSTIAQGQSNSTQGFCASGSAQVTVGTISTQ